MKKIYVLFVVIGFFITTNCFALGNNNNCNTNGQNQGQNQGQLQAQQQGQVQGQAQTSINANANLNKNTNVNANVNGNLNKNKLDNQNNQNITFEGEREYITPIQAVLPKGVTGHNESIKNKGRRYISLSDQTRFSNFMAVETAKMMVDSNSFGAKITLVPKVKKGTYKPTTGMLIYPTVEDLIKENPKTEFIEIGIVTGQSKGKSNSSMLTAKSVIEGCELGAFILVGMSENAERRFKHRGLGFGSSIVDAFGTDTAAGGVGGLNFGSSRYEQFPFQNCYLLRTK